MKSSLRIRKVFAESLCKGAGLAVLRSAIQQITDTGV